MLSTILGDVIWSTNLKGILDIHRHLDEKMFQPMFMPADGSAPLEASSAGDTVIAKFWYQI